MISGSSPISSLYDTLQTHFMKVFEKNIVSFDLFQTLIIMIFLLLLNMTVFTVPKKLTTYSILSSNTDYCTG